MITFKAPCVELIKLENLWFQLSNVACNLKCKHCFLDCHKDTKKRNFLNINKIKNILDTNLYNLKNIYLTGGEPFLHPDFNTIVELSLKKSNLIVYTNGTLINEKKLKNLKNLENLSNYKLSFKISLDSFNEGRNDEYRARGVFKKVLNALKLCQKYQFIADIVCVNLKNEDEKFIKHGFLSLFQKNELNMSKDNVNIVPMLKAGSYYKYHSISEIKNNVSFDDIAKFNTDNLDCKNSRVITINGIYSCPALVNDPRGRLGNNLEESDNNVYLETQTCFDCVKRKCKLFG